MVLDVFRFSIVFNVVDKHDHKRPTNKKTKKNEKQKQNKKTALGANPYCDISLSTIKASATAGRTLTQGIILRPMEGCPQGMLF